MSRPTLGAMAAFVGLLAIVACTSPAAPDIFGEPPEGTHQSALFATVGSGTGGVSVTPQPNPESIFVAVLRFRVRARANTTYVLQRAPETGRPDSSDGLCQRAEGRPPWSPSDPPFGAAFVSFPRPADGPLTTLRTDARGEGSSDFEFRSSALRTGDRFDVQMRLLDDETAPTSELRSACMTVVVR